MSGNVRLSSPQSFTLPNIQAITDASSRQTIMRLVEIIQLQRADITSLNDAITNLQEQIDALP